MPAAAMLPDCFATIPKPQSFEQRISDESAYQARTPDLAARARASRDFLTVQPVGDRGETIASLGPAEDLGDDRFGVWIFPKLFVLFRARGFDEAERHRANQIPVGEAAPKSPPDSLRGVFVVSLMSHSIERGRQLPVLPRRVEAVVDSDDAGARFIAILDEGEEIADPARDSTEVFNDDKIETLARHEIFDLGKFGTVETLAAALGFDRPVFDGPLVMGLDVPVHGMFLVIDRSPILKQSRDPADDKDAKRLAIPRPKG